MFERKIVNYESTRKKVSKLFYAVLTEKLSVREALVKFPKDCNDDTITASWHALCHLESDEDIRNSDKEYKEIQDDYIEFIANTLEKGQCLPENIINSYLPYHDGALTPRAKGLKGAFNNMKKFLCD